MIGSPGCGREVGDDVPAGFAAHQNAAARPRIADAGTDPARAPALVVREVGEIGAVTFAGVKDVKALRAHRREHALDRLDRRARQRQVVAHLVDIAADAAEVGLHVDDDERGVLRLQFAIIGPGIGIGRDVAFRHVGLVSAPPPAKRVAARPTRRLEGARGGASCETQPPTPLASLATLPTATRGEGEAASLPCPDEHGSCRSHFVMLSSAGAPTRVRLGEQVMIMISSVRT